MRKALNAILSLSLLLGLGCKSSESVLAEVGDYKITRKDVEYRNELIRFYFPEDKRKVGLDLLIKSYTNAVVLKNIGHEITPEKLKAEEERIDRNTLQPKKLEQLKAIFGEDVEAYRRVFILPTYADRVIYYEVFTQDPRFHAESFAKAEAIRDEARKTGASLSSLAKKQGQVVSQFTVSRERGLEWKIPEEISDLPSGMPNTIDPSVQAKLKERGDKQASADGERWIREIISPLKPGQVAPQIVSQQEHWQVIRFVRKTGKPGSERYEMESLTIPKANYNDWYEKEKAKVIVKHY